MEVINDLLNYNGLKIVQNKNWFNFSLDSVLLANFVTINKKADKIIDLCTGNAPIPLILTTRNDKLIYGVEIQKDIFDLAQKSININNLEDRIKLINDDYRNLKDIFESDFFDVITCNPPYFELNSLSKLNENRVKALARHEIFSTLEDIFKITKIILKNKGVFAMVHRTDRLIEIIQLMKKYNIEPKKLQMIFPKENKESNIILIEGRKNGNKGLKILPPLYIHDNNGEYKEEIKKMFMR